MATSPPSHVQATDEIHRLIRASIVGKTPLRAVYDGGVRWLCPQMLGRNREGLVRILCLQMGGESASGLERQDSGDWRCLALEKFSRVELVNAAWQSASSGLRRPKCIDQVELEVVGQPERQPQNGQ